MKQPKDPLQLPKPTRNTCKIANKLMTVASGEINLPKHNLTCHVAKVKAATSAHSVADVIPFFSEFNIPFESNAWKKPKEKYILFTTKKTLSVTFPVHHCSNSFWRISIPGLRDSVPIVIWPRGGWSKNRARPMAAQLIKEIKIK